MQPRWNHAGQQTQLKQMLTGHSQASSFNPQLVLSREMNTQHLVWSAKWKESNLKAEVRMSQLQFIPRQSISQHLPFNISTFLNGHGDIFNFLPCMPSLQTAVVSWDTLLQSSTFLETACKPWLNTINKSSLVGEIMGGVLCQEGFSMTILDHSTCYINLLFFLRNKCSCSLCIIWSWMQ